MTTGGTLSARQLKQLKAAFERAIRLPPDERTRFIATACGGDAQLCEELASLLRAHDASGGYLERLADELVMPALRALAAAGDDDEIVAIGRQVSHYDVIERIGGGGMGVVYKARDVRLGRTVALKFLPPRNAESPTARAQLLAEAQAASALDHPNIGVVYEIGETETHRSFIAMAWYESETLKERLRSGPLPVHDAVATAAQICGALAAAHQAGIIHRDLKPANVLITRSGVAKLVDFGIAKLVSARSADEHMTAGTPAYMSPEQTRGSAFDARTDLWSLGVVLYEMLTGRRPFRGENAQLVIEAVREAEPVPITELSPDVPASLGQVVARCLRKVPAERYPSADDFLEALQACEIDVAEVAVESRRGRWARSTSRRSRFVLVGTFVAAIAAATAWEVAQRSRAADAAGAVFSTEARTLAVLPFVNRDGDPTDEPLAAGLADELIARLGEVPGVRVTAGGSAATLLQQGLATNVIGERLGAATVLEGSVARTGEQLRVSAQLLRVSDGVVLWSEDYQAPVSGVFDVLAGISSAVARALPSGRSPTRLASPARPPTADMEAYELYLKGRFSWNQRTGPKLEEALAYYRGAIERDPEFALAYSGMAEAYANMQNFAYMPSDVALTRAEVAVARAIELDSALAEAHSARGFVLASRGAFADSEASFQRAIQLNPSYSWAYLYYALLLTMLGRFDEATDQIQKSLTLDPLSLPANSTLGVLYCARGNYADARAQLQRTVALSPGFALSLYYLGAVEAREGRYAEAADGLERAYAGAPGFPGTGAALAYSYQRLGRPADARRVTDELHAAVRDERSRLNLALGLAVLGDPDSAFAMLQTAQWDVPTLIELRANPLLEQFREDPRYTALLQKSGLEFRQGAS
jgi:eukaryotic-like serine/threonine-protein kinase